MSSERKPVIKKLSKGVLDLKFMKKSKEKVKQLEEDEERKNLYHDQLANLHSTEDKIVLVGSHYDVMMYLPCRLSFGGNDAQIEKLNASKLTGLYKPFKEESVAVKEEDVTKEEMAEHFTSLNENLAKKFKDVNSDLDHYKGYKRPKDKTSNSPRGTRGQFLRGKRGGPDSGSGGFDRCRRGGFEHGKRGRFEHGNRGGFERGTRGGFGHGKGGCKRDSRGEYSSGNDDSFQYSNGSEFELETDDHSQRRRDDNFRHCKSDQKPKRGHCKNINRSKVRDNNSSDNTYNNFSSHDGSFDKRTKFENESE